MTPDQIFQKIQSGEKLTDQETSDLNRQAMRNYMRFVGVKVGIILATVIAIRILTKDLEETD